MFKRVIVLAILVMALLGACMAFAQDPLAFTDPPAAPAQAYADVQRIANGPAWNLFMFPTPDQFGVFRMAIGFVLHPVYGRVVVFWYDNLYNQNDPPGVGDRQVQVCHSETPATKLRNCDPPVRVNARRLDANPWVIR